MVENEQIQQRRELSGLQLILGLITVIITILAFGWIAWQIASVITHQSELNDKYIAELKAGNRTLLRVDIDRFYVHPICEDNIICYQKRLGQFEEDPFFCFRDKDLVDKYCNETE